MYSGDVPAILSARKTYSFRGIELTLPASRRLLGRLRHRHPYHHHPHVRSRPLIRLRDNPRRRRGLLCFFLSPHSTWNISTHPGISRVLQSVSPREESCLRYPKSDDNVRFSCDPENTHFNTRHCQIIEEALRKILERDLQI